MDCMIDIETLGTSPGCVVLSAAAVLFHPEADGSAEAYQAQAEVRFSVLEQLISGATVDTSTIEWWQKQEQRDAAEPLLEADEMRVADGLRLLSGVVSKATGRVWAQGASFDFAILGSLYDRAGVPRPWNFWMERDTRTAYDMAAMAAGFDRKTHDKARTSTAHGAGSDCVHQIATLRAAVAATKGKPLGPIPPASGYPKFGEFKLPVNPQPTPDYPDAELTFRSRRA